MVLLNILENVSFRFMLSGQFRILIMAIISLSAICSSCTQQENELNTLNPKQINEQLLQLEKIVREIDHKKHPEQFIYFYDSCKVFLKSIPNVSAHNGRKIRHIFRIKLESIGIYYECITLIKEIISLKKKDLTINNSVRFDLEMYNKLHEYFELVNQYDSSIYYQEIAIERSKDHSKQIWQSAPLNNMGITLFDLGYQDSAMLYFKKADSLIKLSYPLSKSWAHFEGSVLDNMANYYEFIGDYKSTIPIYLSNTKLYENKRIKRIPRFFNAGNSLANSYIEINMLSEAFSVLQFIRKKELAKDYPLEAENKIYWNKTISKYYDRMGNKTLALKHSQVALVLTTETNIQKIKLQNTYSHYLHKFSMARNKQRIILKNKALIKEKETSRLRMLLIILVVFIALSFVISLYIFYRNNRKMLTERATRIKSEKEIVDLKLEFQKKDLIDITLSLLQKQEWATILNSQIRLILESRGNKRALEFKKLQQQIKNQTLLNNELAIFEQNIDILNTEYYLKLQTQFPNLSKSESQLFSFIKLKLDSYQIAQLKNIEHSSIKVLRHRLKSKLGLDKSQNLDHFVQSF